MSLGISQKKEYLKTFFHQPHFHFNTKLRIILNLLMWLFSEKSLNLTIATPSMIKLSELLDGHYLSQETYNEVYHTEFLPDGVNVKTHILHSKICHLFNHWQHLFLQGIFNQINLAKCLFVFFSKKEYCSHHSELTQHKINFFPIDISRIWS